MFLIFIPFFAPNITVLLIGEICMGIPWGMWQSLSTAYASEVCPVALRSYLTTYVNLCWVMGPYYDMFLLGARVGLTRFFLGQLVASGVLRALLSRTDQWSYRIPFALQVSRLHSIQPHISIG